MLKDELSRILDEMGDIEEIEGKRWEALAYRKASASIAATGKDIRELYRNGTLREIEGVGEAIEKKIRQYIEIGKIDKYEEMKKKYPIDFITLRKLQGLGPKKILSLYEKLGITDIESLKKAVYERKISSLAGFGPKSEESLKKSIETYEKYGANRKFLARVYPEIIQLRDKLTGSNLFTKVEIAGSFRRMRETLGDVDILAVSPDPVKAVEFFTDMAEVEDLISSGSAKTTVRLTSGLTCDFRIFDNSSIGAALQYFTGSKDHNVVLREIAISKGLKLNEYGLYRGDTVVAGSDEGEIYASLGLQWIEPELRENLGEIEAAKKGALPNLIRYDEVRGDLHSHTAETDGKNTLEEMVQAADKNGMDYIAITNHSKSLRVANGMDERAFEEFGKRVEHLNESGRIKVLKGVELEILKDGSLDLKREYLEDLDFVIASLHQNVSTDIHDNTNRVLAAINSGTVNAIAHPTGRLIGSRDGYALDMDSIFDACRDNRVFIEINGYPERSDLPFDMVRKAKARGVSFCLGSDAHNLLDLGNIRFATAIARRGWLTAADVVNTLSFEKFKHAIYRT